MEPRTSRTVVTQKSSNGTLLAIIALLVLGLIVAVMAFDDDDANLLRNTASDDASMVADEQSGTNANANTNTDSNQPAATNQEAQRIATAKTSARTELLAIKQKMASDDEYATAAADIEAIKQSLADAYANASVQAQIELQGIETTFTALQSAINLDANDLDARFDAVINTLN